VDDRRQPVQGSARSELTPAASRIRNDSNRKEAGKMGKFEQLLLAVVKKEKTR
jgi:hypothetical protein